jgi:hypothetical protein
MEEERERERERGVKRRRRRELFFKKKNFKEYNIPSSKENNKNSQVQCT